MHDNENYSEDVGDKDKAKRLRQQKKEERKNCVYTALKFIRGKMIDGCGITRLLVPASWPTSVTYDAKGEYDLKDPKKVKDESAWREVNCPKVIEFLLRLQNQRHFGQAEGTPLTMPLMKKQFNWSASTVEAEMVLKGEYSDPELDEIQTLFLENLIKVTDVYESFKFVTVKEFQGKMKAWRESTTTSPSGRHLGHYKSLIATINRSLDEEEQEQLQQIQQAIMSCYISVINYAIKHCNSLEQWQTIMNNMIYKEPGNVKIHRLQVIHIYEADLALMWGVKWGASMPNSVNNQTIHREQYG